MLPDLHIRAYSLRGWHHWLSMDIAVSVGVLRASIDVVDHRARLGFAAAHLTALRARLGAL